MSVGVTDLAHSVRKSTLNSAVPIPLSRGQQLICAALGHKSLASFQTALGAEREPQSFDGLAHVVPDYAMLDVRARELGLAVRPERLRALIDGAFKERLPGTQVHESFDALADSFCGEFDEAVTDDAGVSSVMAEANHDGVEEVYFEDDLEPEQATVAIPLTVAVEGHVTLGIDKERPYTGHKVLFEAVVTVHRCGLRCFEDPVFEIVCTGLAGYDDYVEPPQRTLAQTFATELGIDASEAEQLVDAEAEALTGQSGEGVYGYLFDFAAHASAELAAKLLAARGSLQLEVGPWFFENIRGMDSPN